MYNLLIKAFKWMINICMFDAFELRFTFSLTGIIHSIPFDKEVSYLLSFLVERSRTWNNIVYVAFYIFNLFHLPRDKLQHSSIFNELIFSFSFCSLYLCTRKVWTSCKKLQKKRKERKKVSISTWILDDGERRKDIIKTMIFSIFLIFNMVWIYLDFRFFFCVVPFFFYEDIMQCLRFEPSLIKISFFCCCCLKYMLFR